METTSSVADSVSAYYNLDTEDVHGMNFYYFEDGEEWSLVTFKYLNFFDDDGEQNFMPVKNISVIELERQLIMTDEQLNILLGNKPNRQTKSKKK